MREVESLSGYVKKLEASGEKIENIARLVIEKRRDLGVKYKALTPQDELDKIFKRNIIEHGDKWGANYRLSQGKREILGRNY